MPWVSKVTIASIDVFAALSVDAEEGFPFWNGCCWDCGRCFKVEGEQEEEEDGEMVGLDGTGGKPWSRRSAMCSFFQSFSAPS